MDKWKGGVKSSQKRKVEGEDPQIGLNLETAESNRPVSQPLKAVFELDRQVR